MGRANRSYQTPILVHLRAQYIESIHPGLPGLATLSSLVAIDQSIVEQLRWLSVLSISADVADVAMDRFYERVKNWVAAAQDDPASVYFIYGSGQ